jgi:hypothetical protein
VLTVHNLDEELRGLLVQCRPIIKTITPNSGVRVCAQVVQELDEGHADPCGVFLSKATLKLLAEVEADLDVDIARIVR